MLPLPSHWLLRITPSDCTRCGRPTLDPANVCSSCAAPRINESGSRTSGRGDGQPAHSRPSVNCAVCRVPLCVRVPSHYQAAQTVLLCPPCQARHTAAAAVKPKPHHRGLCAVPRANPYPVVTPFPKSTPTRAVAASTIAYTYPDLPVSSSPRSGAGWTSDSGAADASTRDSAPRRVCMRFGCGARLPAHVPGDVCAACAGSAGFVHRRPPPRGAAAQERTPGRTFPRLRGSPDLVRASSLRQAVLGVVVGNVEDVESESEVELVYPDVIPVATQCVPTASESKNNKAVDDELELVYPEDAEETMCTPLPKPRAKPPTILRKLFTGGLRPIPPLQDLAALADQSPPRLCRVPGCDQVMPPQTCMERCVKCSINDWKRRKLASMGASDPSLTPSTNSPMTSASTKEMQVTIVLDEASEVEDVNELPPLPTSPSKSNGNGLTDDHCIRPIPGWDNDLTESSSSDSESESISEKGSSPEPEPPTSHEDSTRLTVHIPLFVNRLPSDSLRRKCGNRGCNIALPKGHRWKTCDPCRRAHRVYQRVRLENIRRSIVGIELLEPPGRLCRQWRSLSPEMREADTTLTPETSRPCSTKHCERRIPLPEVYRWKTCVGCRARSRYKARGKRDAYIGKQHTSCQPEVVPRFPAYQNRGALLSSLDAQLRGFVEGQIVYLRAKLHEGETLDQAGSDSRQPKHVPMIFVFVGEYSTVTGQRGDSDVKPPGSPAALDAMRKEVSSIVLELERALRTKFSAGEAFAIDEGGLLMQSTCSLELIAQLRPLTTCVGSGPDPRASTGDEDEDRDESREGETLTLNAPPKQPAVPLVKTLSGELEAVVVPDESHSLLHGRRTVIRYCMLG